MKHLLKGFVLVALVAFNAHANEVKIKDVARVAGVRDNALTGYGLALWVPSVLVRS